MLSRIASTVLALLVVVEVVFAALVLLTLSPVLLPHWLLCRLTARRCPNCSSKWRTELVGEWNGEDDWHCRRCGQFWTV